MAAKFLPDHRLAFAEPRPGSLYAMSMEKSEWAVYTGLLYPAGPSEQTLNFPLPFRPGDLLYDPNSPEATFCSGVFVAAQTDSYSFFLSLLHIIKKQKGKRNNGFFKIYQFKYGS